MDEGHYYAIFFMTNEIRLIKISIGKRSYKENGLKLPISLKRLRIDHHLCKTRYQPEIFMSY